MFKQQIKKREGQKLNEEGEEKKKKRVLDDDVDVPVRTLSLEATPFSGQT